MRPCSLADPEYQEGGLSNFRKKFLDDFLGIPLISFYPQILQNSWRPFLVISYFGWKMMENECHRFLLTHDLFKNVLFCKGGQTLWRKLWGPLPDFPLPRGTATAHAVIVIQHSLCATPWFRGAIQKHCLCRKRNNNFRTRSRVPKTKTKLLKVSIFEYYFNN